MVYGVDTLTTCPRQLTARLWETLADAASDGSKVSGLTHCFYRYPARFSPAFASAAIEAFSQPGDRILDPYMGGGTTIVEAVAQGRRAVGVDLNALAVFVTRAKISVLKHYEECAIRRWSSEIVPALSCRAARDEIQSWPDTHYGRNLTLPRARFLKKIIACAIDSVNQLPTIKSQRFARCAILQTSQLCLESRRRTTKASEFRVMLSDTVLDMLTQQQELADQLHAIGASTRWANIHNTSAEHTPNLPVFRRGDKVDLVVTSPPYPGVHVLYHRWQVDGRKESPAPYWVADCQDGFGASFYNFGGRHEAGLETYFTNSLKTLTAIRRVMRPGATMIQMIAFNDPSSQLPRYLDNMNRAGFIELGPIEIDSQRIWRDVPSRKWHANLRGKTKSSCEVVLVHQAKR